MKPFGKQPSSADRPAERRHRRVISYANVAATLAVVLAMSGGAYAATKVLTTTKVVVKPSPQLLKALATSTAVKTDITKEVDKASPSLFQSFVNSGALKGVAGLAGAVGAPGTTGQQGTPGQAGELGPQGPPGPGAVVKSLSISASSATPQTLFTYGGDSIGVGCSVANSEAVASLDLKGNATTFWGTETSQVDTPTTAPSPSTSPLDRSLSQSSSYEEAAEISSAASSNNSGLYSAQYTVLQSGGLDFHLDFTASIANVNGAAACTFNAAYYPLSTS
jgi:hypothetical protein